MSERKVLNKYYPPDFDPSKIPKLRLPRNRQYSIRIMAPFNMRCDTCGEYIYKGKKFNSRKETVENEDYLGLKIFRFYIKCPCCVSEIAFKTDLKNTDYTLEAGAKRNFEAAKLAEEMEERSRKEKEEEELNNPMKVLENRTKASRQEMEQIDALEELKDLNMRHATVDHETMLKRHAAKEEILRQLQQEEDEKMIESMFSKQDSVVKRLDDEEDYEPPVKKAFKTNKPSDILTVESNINTSLPSSSNSTSSDEKKPVWERSVGLLSSKSSLSMLIKRKPKSTEENKNKPTHDKAEEVSKTSRQISTPQEHISSLQQNVDVKNIPLPSESPKPVTDKRKFISSKTFSDSTSGVGLEAKTFSKSTSGVGQLGAKALSNSPSGVGQLGARASSNSPLGVGQPEVKTSSNSASDLSQSGAKTLSNSPPGVGQLEAKASSNSASGLSQLGAKTSSNSTSGLGQLGAKTSSNPTSGLSGLGLLGTYSDSDSDS